MLCLNGIRILELLRRILQKKILFMQCRVQFITKSYLYIVEPINFQVKEVV